MTADAATADPVGPGTASRAASALRQFLPSLDRTRLVYATNVALIAALALACSFLLDLDRSYWALLTVALVSQATSGLTVWRSLARTVGTLIGAGFALAALALFAQNSVAMMAALSLWIFFVSMLARFEIGLDAYAYSVAGLTALVIAFDTGANAGQAYEIALVRTTETLIGIGAAFAVILVFFPVSASRVLLDGIAEARNRVVELSRKAAAIGDEIDVGETQGVTKALAATYANLRAHKLERSHRRVSTRKAAQAANLLNRLLIAAERMSYALAGLDRADPPAKIAATSRRLGELLDAMPRPDMPPSAIAAHAGAFRAVVAEIDLDPEIAELLASADRPTSREVVALSATRRFAAAMAAYLDAEAAIRDPAAPVPANRRVAARYPDRIAAVERGIRPTLVFLGLSTLWLASSGSPFQTLALIATGLCVTLPAIAPRAALTSGGKALGLGFAAMFLPVLALEATLPYVESFLIFALLVGGVFFVFFYLCFDPMLRTYALGGAIFLATALQPSNVQQYDALGAFNAAVSLAPLPLAIVAAFTIIVPENQKWLRRRLRRAADHLLARAAKSRDDHPDEFLAQSLDAIGDYGGDLDLAEPANRADVRRARAVTAAGLQLYELNRMKRLGHLPEPLAALLAPVADAIRSEAEPGEAQAPRVLDESRRRAYAMAGGSDLPELARSSALRFAVGVEFLQVLVEDGRLKAAG